MTSRLKNTSPIPLIAWDEDLIRLLERKQKIAFNKDKIIKSSFRPFINKYLYCDEKIISRLYSWPSIHNGISSNKYISLRCVSSDQELTALASDSISDLGYLKTGNGGTFSISLYHYDSTGKQSDNITSWGLQQFTSHYKDKKITKEGIFHYVYACPPSSCLPQKI